MPKQRYRCPRFRLMVTAWHNYHAPMDSGFPGSDVTVEAMEFGRAMQAYMEARGLKDLSGVCAPDAHDILTVAHSLGYRKDGDSSQPTTSQ